VRILLAGLIVGLSVTAMAYAGQGEGDAAPLPAGDSAAGELRDPAACGACTLRHRNLTRRAKELQAAEEARGACQIKGDITATGERVYYQPGDPGYAWTWIDEAAGERWFCSAEEAGAAGWRGPAD
jgi:hypothetical protein